MRFTPSTNWSIANSAAYRKIAWTTEVRIVSVLDTALFTGTWTRIDSFIHEIDDIHQAIEYNPGQFTADSITLTVGNISWWDTNFLGTTDYIEFRRLPSIGIGASMMSTDQACAFHGFIDNREGQLHYSNETDEVTFTVYTPDDIGSRISALNVNTQYVNQDIDGAGTDGLTLPKITGVFVQDANIASYVLKKGLHTLTFQYNAGTEQMKLDDGSYTSLPGSDGTVDLVNGDGDQKIKLYVDVSELPNDTEIIDYVIVITAGTTLPRQPYFGVSTDFILRKLYEQIGFTNANVTTDTLSMSSYDAAKWLSFYDYPPQNVSITGERNSVCFDGTDIWVGVGDKLYKRIGATSSYVLQDTIDAGYKIRKLIYNARNSHVWILAESGAASNPGFNKVYVFRVGTGITAGLTVSSNSYVESAKVIDYNYTGSSYKYGLIHASQTGTEVAIVTISGGTLTKTTIDNTDPYYYNLLYIKSGNELHYVTDDGATGKIHKYHVDATGAFVDDGLLANGNVDFISSIGGEYNANDDKIYYWLTTTLKYYIPGSAAAATTVMTGISADRPMLYDDSAAIYFTGTEGTALQFNLYKVAAGTVTKLSTQYLRVKFGGFYYSGTTLYGIDIIGRLWQYSATLQMYLKHTVFEDISVKDAINQVLGAYNLIGKISSHKKVNILRRGNDSGTKQTTGDAITINTTNCASVQKTQNAYPAVSWVEVSSGTITHSYDGTNFDTAVFSDAKTFTLSNQLIPDEMVKHIAVKLYAFWSIARATYQFEMLGAPMEYEVMDGADVTISGEYVNLTSSAGLIIGQTINNFGRCIFDVLF